MVSGIAQAPLTSWERNLSRYKNQRVNQTKKGRCGMKWMDEDRYMWVFLALVALFFWFQLIRAGISLLFK
jgi:hypothetical protein